MKIALLMEYASEVGMEYLKELRRRAINVSEIVCIGNAYPARRAELLAERTGGFYTRDDFENLVAEQGLQINIVEDVNGQDCFDVVKKLGVDLVVAENTRIITNPIFDLPPLGMLNTHIAILPYMRGCSCLEWAVLEDRPVGASCHYMAQSVDAGPLIERVRLQIDSEETYESLRAKSIYLQAYTMGLGAKRIVCDGFRRDNAIALEKGVWYSPMRGPKDVSAVKQKLMDGTYHPKDLSDTLPIHDVAVDLSQGVVSRI